MATLIDGKLVAARMRERIRAEVEFLRAQAVTPGLAAILVGENPASHTYVNAKSRACLEVGIHSEIHKLPPTAAFTDLLALIEQLNRRPDIHGILVQSPLPSAMDEFAAHRALSPLKDVDCFHPENVGLLTLGAPRFVPCTPAGVIELLRAYDIPLVGAPAVIVGRSNIVGRPLATLLSQKGADATVTLCHSRTRELGAMCRSAEILIAAIGQAEMITGEMVANGATVIDVGVNRVPDPASRTGYRLVGDTCFSEIEKVAGHITPVPGGVGPMTIAMLLRNTLSAAQSATGRSAQSTS